MRTVAPSVWEVLSVCVHRVSRWFTYELRRYRLPDGQEAEFNITLSQDGVAIVAVTVDFKEVILCREFRPGPHAILDEVCGGLVEPGEGHFEAATRELREETGYTGRMIYLGSSWRDAKSTGRTHHYLCYAVQQTHEPVAQPCEFVQVVRMNWENFVAHAQRGELTAGETAFRAIHAQGTFKQKSNA